MPDARVDAMPPMVVQRQALRFDLYIGVRIFSVAVVFLFCRVVQVATSQYIDGTDQNQPAAASLSQCVQDVSHAIEIDGIDFITGVMMPDRRRTVQHRVGALHRGLGK